MLKNAPGVDYVCRGAPAAKSPSGGDPLLTPLLSMTASSTALAVIIYTSMMSYMHCTCVFVPLEGPTGRNFEPHLPLTPSRTMQQGLYGGGAPKRDVPDKSWF